MIYIGIDNGLTGGLVALSENPSPPIDMITMPTRNKKKGNEVDAEAIYQWLHQWDKSEVSVVIETPGKHSPGIMALCSMWDSYGVLRAICEVKGLRHHRIAPQTWQKKILVGCKKGDTKPAALAMTKRLWPTHDFLATARSSVPHNGLIDAALIAEYARRESL